MESHSVPSRAEAFPVGLRVLVVDDDPTWLKILEKMLRKCSYEVTTCGLARVALESLRERKNKFDIVISDVNMPDMDGFKLLEHIGLEMDLPVIMMSIDGETSRVMKGVQHGACDYLLKPVRMKELRNIWQHVYRKKMHEVKEIEGHDLIGDDLFIRSMCEGFDDGSVLTRGEAVDSVRKRKELDGSKDQHSDQDSNDPTTVKKPRVVWSVDLHQKFVNAVNQIGFDKVGPKKILDLMNVPGLTRENVASHLQKYRLYLSRLQKQKDERTTFTCNKQSDFNSKDPIVNLDLQNPIHIQQRNTTSGDYGSPPPKIEQAELNKPNTHQEDFPDKKKTSSTVSQLGVVLSFKSTTPSVETKPTDPTTTLKHTSWNGSLPRMQFMQYPKHDHERCDLLEDYSCLPKPDLANSIPANQFYTAPPMNSINCNVEKDCGDYCDVKPAIMDCIKSLPSLTCTVDGSSLGIEGLQNVNQSLVGPVNLMQEPGLLSGIDLVPLPDDLHLYSSLQGIGCFENVGFMNSIELFPYNNSTPLTEVDSNNWCDGSEFGSEPMDYPLMDECLFA